MTGRSMSSSPISRRCRARRRSSTSPSTRTSTLSGTTRVSKRCSPRRSSGWECKNKQLRRRLVGVRHLARALHEQVELLLATMLDQHLRRANQVFGGRRDDCHEVELARITAVRPLHLIFGAVLDRKRGWPRCESGAGAPAQLLRLAVCIVDLDRDRGLLVRPPQLQLRSVADAYGAALRRIDVPDAGIVRDIRRAKSAEAATLSGGRGERDL